jgi:hypothetical protein
MKGEPAAVPPPNTHTSCGLSTWQSETVPPLVNSFSFTHRPLRSRIAEATLLSEPVKAQALVGELAAAHSTLLSSAGDGMETVAQRWPFQCNATGAPLTGGFAGA